MTDVNSSSSSLGLYIHVPFCKHACPYCDFYKLELKERPSRERLEFPALIAREHELLVTAHPELANRPLATIYFGGGTPSTLQPNGVQALIRKLHESHGMGPSPGPGANSVEVTLEANPENLTPGRCVTWMASGITRLSIGVQSFHEKDLQLLERLHDRAAILNAIGNARMAGIRNVSIDLMFALPGQTMESWQENLRRAVDLGPDHISFYGLTYHERTPFREWLEKGKLEEISEDLQADMYLWGAEFLESHGFEHYEISNFARPGFRSQHNQRYWRAEDVVGLGPGAHSNLGPLRWQNPEDIDSWRSAVLAGKLPRTEPEKLSAGTRVEEELFRLIRRKEGFAIGTDAGDAESLFIKWLDSAAGREALRCRWVVEAGGRYMFTKRGWLVSDGVLAAVVGGKS